MRGVIRLVPVLARLGLIVVFVLAVGTASPRLIVSSPPPAARATAALSGPAVGRITLVGAAEAAPAAPGFRVKVLDSSRYVDTRELIGKRVLVLRFQSSYCKPCGRESAGLDRIAARYRQRDVEVLALHVQDTAVDTRRFLKRHRATYAVALDPTLTIGNRYGFKGTPYTVVVDRRGEMVAQIHGVSAVSRLPRILDETLAADPPPKP
ncbi:MAG TPA: TlpA disulfide reductase family protein [Methylomirabilota bacterium]|nr:TlpA disulfide reductase family protein [Methylomirabilota bacterium]